MAQGVHTAAPGGAAGGDSAPAGDSCSRSAAGRAESPSGSGKASLSRVHISSSSSESPTRTSAPSSSPRACVCAQGAAAPAGTAGQAAGSLGWPAAGVAMARRGMRD
eukprot:7347111-Heterocapsa_arctica.AAC.1